MIVYKMLTVISAVKVENYINYFILKNMQID